MEKSPAPRELLLYSETYTPTLETLLPCLEFAVRYPFLVSCEQCRERWFAPGPYPHSGDTQDWMMGVL